MKVGRNEAYNDDDDEEDEPGDKLGPRTTLVRGTRSKRRESRDKATTAERVERI
jgi:hypothetical protein